jgi:conjugal transfer pilus assembly protein TraW
MARLHVLLLATALAAPCGIASAKQLGKIGPTYPISEPHLLEQIMSKLQEAQRRGDFERFEKEAQERAVATVRNPQPVTGLVRTQQPSTRYFDPTFTLEENILDGSGKVMFPAGLQKNPLDVVSLSSYLLFFDASDVAQVRTAEALVAKYEGRVKPILVGGSYIDLMQRWKRRVYFDQTGYLVRRLGIQRVPSFVSQEGKRLRIDEVVPQ